MRDLINRIKEKEETIYAHLKRCNDLKNICKYISGDLFNNDIEVDVCNENRFMCFRIDNYFYFYYLKDSCGGFLNELVTTYSVEKVSELTLGVLKRIKITKQLSERLAIPNVVLINLHNKEQYPSYRFALGIADIAGYLRKYYLAHVDIIDMQFFDSEEVFSVLKNNQYDFIGLSANFGHFSLLEEYLSFIGEECGKSQVVIGNYLGATEYKKILNLYPKLIVCASEGELSIAQLCINYRRKVQLISNVPNIIYDDNGTLRKSFSKLIEMDELPIPAFDTVEHLFQNKGVMTLEFSRGCNYGKCSFCPRQFKGLKWRGMSTKKMVYLWNVYYDLFKRYTQDPYVYFADEEFLGNCHIIDNYLRIRNFVNEIIVLGEFMKYDIACRVDQVVDDKRNQEWIKKQIELFFYLKRIGLRRIFVGLEAGSDEQMQRYKKGISIQQAVVSLRLLSYIGMDLRIGFITFDPLMKKEDLKKTIKLLNREDIILKRYEQEYNDNVLETLLKDESEISSSIHLYEKISYLASPLELLRGCEYTELLRKEYSQLITCAEETDNFGRFNCGYIDPEISLIQSVCQKWINASFAFVYTVKGMAKRHDENEEKYKEMIKVYRQYTYYLLVTLCYQFGIIDSQLLNQIITDDIIDTILYNKITYKDVVEEYFKRLVLRIREILVELQKEETTPGILIDLYLIWSKQDVMNFPIVREL